MKILHALGVCAFLGGMFHEADSAPPVIDGGKYQTLDINENIPDGGVVFTVQTDRECVYQLYGPDKDQFSIHPAIMDTGSNKGNVTIVKSPKWKSKPEFNVGIMAIPVSEIARVNITLDVAMPPKFSHNNYVATICDNIVYGASITKVTAYGHKGRGIKYHIVHSTVNDKFSINEDNGYISLRMLKLPRRGNYKLNLSVFAEDTGSPPQRADAKVTITVKTCKTPNKPSNTASSRLADHLSVLCFSILSAISIKIIL